MTETSARKIAAVKQCETCGGTGKVISTRSAIMTDGTFKEKCGICGGTGQSSYHHHDRKYVRWQADARKSFPRHPHLAVRAILQEPNP